MTLAGESQMDEAAERLGLDSLEIRRATSSTAASGRGRGSAGIDADLAADLELAAEELDWDATAGARARGGRSASRPRTPGRSR